MATQTDLVVPAFIRGATIDTDLVTFGGRDGEAAFRAPDPASIVGRLPLRDPAGLADLHALPFDEIVAYLAAVGPALDPSTNPLLQQAIEHAEAFSDMTPPLVRASFEQLPSLFTAAAVREIAELTIGVVYLEGWVDHRLADGRTASIRAMGARAIHIVAGNSPLISALSLIRNAICRSDAVVKAPSNDPLTALAIARTMAEVAPDHPITRHVSVAYWKGGDTETEAALYQPRNIEKIIAWGGFASVTHVLRYVRPGIELVTLDPKRSATIIGPEAFGSDATLREVALRAATDVGALNQLGCVNARVIYVLGEPEDATRLGSALYDALLALPEHLSTPARRFDPELRAAIQALRASPDFYRVFGGADDEGAVIVSQFADAVDFHRSLSGRVANIVPVDGIADVVREVNAATQTIGIYPEFLKRELRDTLPLHGAQRLVSLGYAAHPGMALPQDAIEPVRRMVRWIVDESCDAADVQPLWTSTRP